MMFLPCPCFGCIVKKPPLKTGTVFCLAVYDEISLLKSISETGGDFGKVVNVTGAQESVTSHYTG